MEDLGELEGAEGDVGTLPVEGEDHLQEKRATLHWFVVQLDSAIFQFNSCRFLLYSYLSEYPIATVTYKMSKQSVCEAALSRRYQPCLAKPRRRQPGCGQAERVVEKS